MPETNEAQTEGRTHETLVDAQFGQRTRHYVESAIHAGGADLQRIEAIARSGRFEHALDLGCGGGHVAYALAPYVGHVVATDLSAAMLAAVREEARRRGLSNIEPRQATAEQLPFGDAAFDLVVSRYSVHHWRDWEAGLREARRVVRSGGRIVFADVMAPEQVALDTHLQAAELLRDPSHVRDYTRREWIMSLARADLRPVAFQTDRLALDFTSWTERMATPELARRAIRWLQTGAADEVRKAFEIEKDGSFTVDTIFIEAETTGL